jgi:hypothetical protein
LHPASHRLCAEILSLLLVNQWRMVRIGALFLPTRNSDLYLDITFYPARLIPG